MAARPARARGLAAMVTAGAKPDEVAEAPALEARELADEAAADALERALFAEERADEAPEAAELAALLAPLLRLLAAEPAALVTVLVMA